ncbi:MAG: hypothetical protein JOZ29_01200 [Deltaproteobacteria bacterium]|nr:hypothetical protein [Deltaproteobacteria bacterium]
MHKHLGTSFTVWSRRRTWFWSVFDQHRTGGTIGTAATEAEAIRDACSSIEEMSVQLPSCSASPGRADGKALMPALNRAYPYSAAMAGWMDWWMNTARRVADRMLCGWAELVVRSS